MVVCSRVLLTLVAIQASSKSLQRWNATHKGYFFIPHRLPELEQEDPDDACRRGLRQQAA